MSQQTMYGTLSEAVTAIKDQLAMRHMRHEDEADFDAHWNSFPRRGLEVGQKTSGYHFMIDSWGKVVVVFIQMMRGENAKYSIDIDAQGRSK